MRTETDTLQYRDFSRALHSSAAEKSAVVKAQVELTYGCNLRCVHCYTDCYNKPELLKRERSTGEILRTLDQLHDAGILWVCFTGGEIFMRRDFLEIYDHAKGKGFLLTLFSNGTLFTPALADHLKSQPPFAIELSCHGATEETFDRVTLVPGSFRRFLAGIELLRSRGLPFKIKTKAMTLNRRELGKIKAFVEGLGLTFRLNGAIYPRLDGDLEPCAYRLKPSEIADLEFGPEDGDEEEKSCSAIYREGNGTLTAPPHMHPNASADETQSGGATAPPDNRLFRCGCGTVAVHVNAWGQLGACTWVNEPRADLAEMSVSEAVAQIFPRIRGARYQTDTPCRTCPVYALCDKMPAIAAAENGDAEKPVEHFCETAFARAGRRGLLEAAV